jgi:hypothetical protein
MASDGVKIVQHLQRLEPEAKIKLHFKDKSLTDEWKIADAVKNDGSWLIIREDSHEHEVFENDNEDKSLYNPENWTIGWYKLDSEDNLATEESNLPSNDKDDAVYIKAGKYEVGGETHQLQMVHGTEVTEYTLFSEVRLSEDERTFFTTLNQVKTSQESPVYVFCFAALPVDIANTDTANIFGVVFDFSSSVLVFVKLEELQPVKNDELLSFNVDEVALGMKQFIEQPTFTPLTEISKTGMAQDLILQSKPPQILKEQPKRRNTQKRSQT